LNSPRFLRRCALRLPRLARRTLSGKVEQATGMVGRSDTNRCGSMHSGRGKIESRLAAYDLVADATISTAVESSIPLIALLRLSRCTKNGSSALSVQLQTTKTQNSLCQSTTWKPIGKTERLIVCCRPKSSEIIDSRRLPLLNLHRKCERTDLSTWSLRPYTI
jgi:hypothetical protein